MSSNRNLFEIEEESLELSRVRKTTTNDAGLNTLLVMEEMEENNKDYKETDDLSEGSDIWATDDDGWNDGVCP